MCRISDMMVIGDGVVKRCGKLLHEGVDVIDGVVKRPWKVYGEGVGIGDDVGGRSVVKSLRDGMRVRDRVGKRVGLVRVEIVSVVDGCKSGIVKVIQDGIHMVDVKRVSGIRLLVDGVCCRWWVETRQESGQ